MRVICLRRGTLEALGTGLLHITGTVRPVLARPGDIVIAEHCAVGGNALEYADRTGIHIFLTGAGGAKVYLWLPVGVNGGQLALQCVGSNTEHVRRRVAHWMIQQRFGRTFHPAHGVNVLRGYEGAEIRKLYSRLAREHGIPWGRRETQGDWQEQSPINKTISLCNAALYGITEIAILSAGYSPWFGFMHGRSGKALVYDVADMVKFQLITPLAFRFVADGRPHPEWRARAAVLRLLRHGKLLRKLIAITGDLMHVATTALADGPPRWRGTDLSRYMARDR